MMILIVVGRSGWRNEPACQAIADHSRGWRLALFAWLFFSTQVSASDHIGAPQAQHHIGERATVCGKVASARHASDSRGQPTFLDLDGPYPDQIFTVVIWGEHRDKFSEPPERLYRDKRLCVTGEITSHRDVPQIVVTAPSQIETATEETVVTAPLVKAPRSRTCVPRSQCCKVCSTGQACGNSCISRSYTCHVGRGCACNRSDLC
jgi:hypothetical protein